MCACTSLEAGLMWFGELCLWFGVVWWRFGGGLGWFGVLWVVWGVSMDRTSVSKIRSCL